MDEYIKRAEVIKILEEAHDNEAVTPWNIGEKLRDAIIMGMTASRVMELKAIELPADTAPVVHAMWVFDWRRMKFCCSACGEPLSRKDIEWTGGFDKSEKPISGTLAVSGGLKYCNGCGARMDQ